MGNLIFDRIEALCEDESELDATVVYLTQQLSPIIRAGEPTLICFPREKENDLGRLAERAVINCGSQPVFWDKDLRWKELLRLAFFSKATTIIAPPLVTLGLTKVAAYRKVPLNIYNVVMAGYPCLDWMMDGIEKGLDCNLSGIFGPGIKSVVSGFSCSCGRGIHIRDDVFGVEIVDEQGNELPDGQYGNVVFFHKREPENRFVTRIFGSIMTQRCPCGNPSPKLVGMDVGEYTPTSLLKIAENLLYWNSILDCRLSRTEYGIELEVICFPGEKMPQLPSCARLIVRPWDPEKDIPISIGAGWTIP